MLSERYQEFLAKRINGYKEVQKVNPEHFFSALEQSHSFLLIFFCGIRMLLEDSGQSLTGLIRDERKKGVILGFNMLCKVCRGYTRTVSFVVLFLWSRPFNLTPFQVYEYSVKQIKKGRKPKRWLYPVPLVV